MAVQQATKAEISLTFLYKKDENSKVKEEKILAERISYIMIEHMYENVHILPVIYVSLNISSDMYTKMVNTSETSKFKLIIKKKNALSKTSLYTKVVSDSFTYVASSNAANYTDTLNKNTQDSYKSLMIGLVSDTMTNLLRKNFNGVYNNITTEDLINIALEGMPNIIKADLRHNSSFESILIPPLSSRYRLLDYIRSKAPFYDSNYTFYMDFEKTYLIPKNAIAIAGKDNKPTNVIIDIKNYTAEEAYTDGYTIKNNAYCMYINATDTNMIINNSTSKVTNNIVGFTDYNSETQNFTIDNNNTQNNSTKTTYVRDLNTAAIRNELENNSVMIELLKQNLDGDIFTPNKSYKVNNYGKYSKYDGSYYLSYKREFYYINTDNTFTVTNNVGLKLAGNEEVAKSVKNIYNQRSRYSTRSGKKNTTASQNKRNSTNLRT